MPALWYIHINTKKTSHARIVTKNPFAQKDIFALELPQIGTNEIQLKQRCSLIITGQANFGNVKILKVPVPPVFPLLRIGSVTGVLQIFPYVQKCAKAGGGCAKAGCVQNQEVSVQKQEVAEQKLPRPNHL